MKKWEYKMVINFIYLIVPSFPFHSPLNFFCLNVWVKVTIPIYTCDILDIKLDIFQMLLEEHD